MSHIEIAFCIFHFYHFLKSKLQNEVQRYTGWNMETTWSFDSSVSLQTKQKHELEANARIQNQVKRMEVTN